jgi:hypothetical protein
MEREGIHNECVCEFAFSVEDSVVLEIFVK